MSQLIEDEYTSASHVHPSLGSIAARTGGRPEAAKTCAREMVPQAPLIKHVTGKRKKSSFSPSPFVWAVDQSEKEELDACQICRKRGNVHYVITA
jgi:hypothetical protein